MASSRYLLSTLLLIGCSSTMSRPVAPVRPAPIAIHEPRPATKLDRAAIRAKLAERRAVAFQRFLAYREGRVYPMADLPGGGFRHVWIDPAGNLCAAATIISGDWGRDATVAAIDGNLELALAGVTSGPLADWMLTSGLTHHEIVAIQVPGWEGARPEPQQPDVRTAEIQRLYGIYVDVERQLRALANESLDEATDALMQRPDLARELLAGRPAGPGKLVASK